MAGQMTSRLQVKPEKKGGRGAGATTYAPFTMFRSLTSRLTSWQCRRPSPAMHFFPARAFPSSGVKHAALFAPSAPVVCSTERGTTAKASESRRKSLESVQQGAAAAEVNNILPYTPGRWINSTTPSLMHLAGVKDTLTMLLPLVAGKAGRKRSIPLVERLLMEMLGSRYINGELLEYVLQNKSLTGSACQKRPDFSFLEIVGNCARVVFLEADERGHRYLGSYSLKAERRRERELRSACYLWLKALGISVRHIAVTFVRYNPHSYMADGQRRATGNDERHGILLQLIWDLLNGKEPFYGIIYLFYGDDNPHLEQSTPLWRYWEGAGAVPWASHPTLFPSLTPHLVGHNFASIRPTF